MPKDALGCFPNAIVRVYTTKATRNWQKMSVTATLHANLLITIQFVVWIAYKVHYAIDAQNNNKIQRKTLSADISSMTDNENVYFQFPLYSHRKMRIPSKIDEKSTTIDFDQRKIHILTLNLLKKTNTEKHIMPIILSFFVVCIQKINK